RVSECAALHSFPTRRSSDLGATLRTAPGGIARAFADDWVRRVGVHSAFSVRAARGTSRWLCLALGTRLTHSELASNPLLGGNMAIDQIELGRRIRQARESCGMTQDEVAEKLGVSRPIVVQIEQGKRTVS